MSSPTFDVGDAAPGTAPTAPRYVVPTWGGRSVLVDAQLHREAEASVALDRDQTHTVDEVQSIRPGDRVLVTMDPDRPDVGLVGRVSAVSSVTLLGEPTPPVVDVRTEVEGAILRVRMHQVQVIDEDEDPFVPGGRAIPDPIHSPDIASIDPTADTCPVCRHRTHGETCFNMASDDDCDCAAGRPTAAPTEAPEADTRRRYPPYRQTLLDLAQLAQYDAIREGVRLTPTQDLVAEVLMARVRLGESCWTFDARHKRAIDALITLGYVKHYERSPGNPEKYLLVWPGAPLLAWMYDHPYRPIENDEEPS